MKISNTPEKERRMLTISFLVIGLLVVSWMVPIFIEIPTLNKTERSDKFYAFTTFLQTSGAGGGGSLNTTIHQSKLGEGSPLYTIISTSNPNNNTFSSTCPDDGNFTNTNQEIIIKDIYAPNKSITYEGEDYLGTGVSLGDSSYAASFWIEGSGRLENISVFLSNDEDGNNGNLTLHIYKAKDSDSELYNFTPNGVYNDAFSNKIVEDGFEGWYNFTNLNFFLNTSKTAENNYFVVLNDTLDDTFWNFTNDAGPGLGGDDSNDLDCFEKNGQNWEIKTVLIQNSYRTIDLTLKCNFAPTSNIPNATDINLKINNKKVSDLTIGEGIWNYKETYEFLPDTINFTITAEWWDVSCNITKIQVNYTRTDLKASISYFFNSDDQAVQWNATLGIFKGFDKEFSNYWINFTVPKSWENITAYNATEEITDKIQFGREFKIYSASNGTNWYISAESPRFRTNIEIVSKPDKIQPGDDFELRFYVSYLNSSDTIPYPDVDITVETYINDELDRSETNSTNENGIVLFRIFVPNDANSLHLLVNQPGDTEYTSTFLQIDDITVLNPSSSPSGININDFLPLIIIIGVIAGAGIGTLGVYKGVIVPKKRKGKETLEEIKMMFDDAINVEYLLVIYKESGVAIFFKSMGTNNIDPDLISGFISAVSSFGEKIELEQSLKEMKYGDKTVLLSEGEYIRAAIVLNKKGSDHLRKKIITFVEKFEERYADILPEWRSELKVFKDAGDLVDKIFNTSIILPHIVKYTISDIKNLEYGVSKNILYEGETLLEEPGRDYFFIGKILSRLKEETEKEIGEIFMGIKELREKGLLIPLELSDLEEEGVTGEENKKILRSTFEHNV